MDLTGGTGTNQYRVRSPSYDWNSTTGNFSFGLGGIPYASGSSSLSSQYGTRPYGDLGKNTVSFFPYGNNTEDFKPPPAFSGIPVLEQAASLGGEIGKWGGRAIGSFFTPPVVQPKKVWDYPDFAKDPERLRLQGLIDSGQIDEYEAQSRFLEYRIKEVQKEQGDLYHIGFDQYVVPPHDAGGTLLKVADLLWAPQRGYQRSGGLFGNWGTSQTLEKLLKATDDELRGQDLFGNLGEVHQELVDIRNAVLSGELSKDEAQDALILSGFATSLPSHPIHSLFDELVSDPVNLVSLGIGTLVKVGGRTGVKLLGMTLGKAATEIGNEAAQQLIKQVSGRQSISYFKELLGNPQTAKFAQAAFDELPLRERVLVERFPMVINVAQRVENLLDPLTLFTSGPTGKVSQKYFSFQATQGAVDAFRKGTFLNINSAVTRAGGVDAASKTEELFARATTQVVAQVGNEARVQKMLLTRSIEYMPEGPTRAAWHAAENYGTDITRYVRDKTEKVRRRFIPLKEGEAGLSEMYARVRPRAARQVARMYDIGIDEATEIVGKMSDDELSLVDFLHYGHVVKEFTAARKAASVASGSQMPIIDRLTFAGPHQMSRQDWKNVKDAIKKGDWATVRSAIERWDDLRYNISPDLSDAELREAITPLMDKIKDWLPTTLKKKTIDKLPADIKRFMDTYGADGYELLLRPADEVAERATRNADGLIERINPWVDYIDEGLDVVKVRGRMNAAYDSVFKSIAGSSIHRAATHTFIRNAAYLWGLPEDRARGLLYAIEKAANRSGVTIRGLTPGDMYKAALTVKLPEEFFKKIGPRELAELVVVSWEGSLKQVGVTQKISGIAKSIFAPAGNWIGHIAEGVFPTVRFSRNPFFQLQETIEAPTLMLLRGWYTAEEIGYNALDTLFPKRGAAKARKEAANLLNEQTKIVLDLLGHLTRGGFYRGDMFELSDLALFGREAARDLGRVGQLKTFPFSKWAAKVANTTGPLGIKRRAEARAFRYVYGKRIASALKEVSPSSHRFMTEWYRARWAHPGGLKMSEGEFFVQYMMDIITRANPDKVFEVLPMSAMQPSHVGRRARTSLRLTRYILGVEEDLDWSALRKQAADPTNLDMTEDRVRELFRLAGADDDYTERVLHRLFGFTADEYWEGVLKNIGPNTKVARKDVEAIRSFYKHMADSMEMSEDEYLGRRFAGVPLSIDQFGNVKGKAQFQMLRDAFQLRGLKAIEAGSPEDMTFREFVQQATPKFVSQNEPWRAAPNGDIAEYADISALEKYIEAEEFDPEVISRLAEDIRANGIEEPIVLEFAPGTSKVRVTDGLKRMAAAREAGLRRVPVFARRNDGLERGIRYTKVLPEDQLTTPSKLGFRTSRTAKTLAEMSDAERKHADAFNARMLREADPTLGSPVSGRVGNLEYGPRSFADHMDELDRVMTEYERVEALRWYDDIRTGLFSMYGEPEAARRALLGFAVSQRNASPEDGFGYLWAGLERLRRGQELPIEPGVLGKSPEQLRLMLLDQYGETRGLGQKLMDFIDSLAGASTRSVGVSPSGRAVPWGPAAGDLWAKRGLGFIDEALFETKPGQGKGSERIHNLVGSLAFERNADGDYVMHFAGEKRPDLGPDVEMVSTDQLWEFIEVDRTRIPKWAEDRGVTVEDVLWELGLSPVEMPIPRVQMVMDASTDFGNIPPAGTRSGVRRVISREGVPITAEVVENPMGRIIPVPGTERPLEYVYRAVSEEDYQQMLKSGFMKSDERMNLVKGEGTVASKDDPSWYLPGRNQASAPLGDYEGRILKIRVEASDGWEVSKADSYIKTQKPVPVDRIEASPVLVTRKAERVTQTGGTVVDVDTFVKNPKKVSKATQAGRYLDELEREVRQNGITEPIIVYYDAVTNTASVADGNHRLAVARRMGLTEVPTRVQTTRQGAFDPSAEVMKSAIPGGRKFQPIHGLRFQREQHYFPGNPLPSDLSFYGLSNDEVIPKAHVGATDPSALEYDYIEEYFNDFADYLSAENYMERKWTAAEVQALDWYRIRKQTGDLGGGPLSSVFTHKWDFPLEIAPGKFARLRDVIPEDLSPEVAEELNLYLMPHLQRLVEERTGVKVIFRFSSVGMWQGATTPNINMEVIGSADGIDKAMAYLGLLVEQDEVFASQLVEDGVVALSSTGKWNNLHHAIDWVLPDGATEAHAREVARALAADDGHALVRGGGAQVVHYAEGRYGVRTVWMPEGEVGAEYVNGFAKVHPDDQLMLVKLDDFDEPVIPLRTAVRLKDYTNDWKANRNGDAYAALLGSDREGTSLAEELVRGDADEVRDLADAFLAQRAGRERAINAAGRVAADGDTYFQQVPRGTLGATVTRADGKHQYYLSKARRRDTFLHEVAHAWLQDLDPSGVRQLLDAYNAEVLARRSAGRPPRKYGHKMARQTQVANTDFHEWFANNFVEWVRTGNAPHPGLKPLFQHFNRVLKQSRLRGSLNKEVRGFLDDAARVAPARPYAYNVDEQTILDFAVGNFRAVDRESKDLIYFKGERNLFERSLNHPYLGLYPLSYMWGKVLPELVEFLAFRPFGFQAPLLGLNVVNDIYKGVMLQQEYDPELRAWLENYEPALRAIGMMVPGLPWDLPVNAPLWVRRLSEAYSTNRLREMNGMEPLAVDVPRITADSLQYMFGPVQGTLSLTELGEGIAALGELAVGSVAGQIPKVTEPRIETPPLVQNPEERLQQLPSTLRQQDIYLQDVLLQGVSPSERPDNAVDTFVEEF